VLRQDDSSYIVLRSIATRRGLFVGGESEAGCGSVKLAGGVSVTACRVNAGWGAALADRDDRGDDPSGSMECSAVPVGCAAGRLLAYLP